MTLQRRSIAFATSLGLLMMMIVAGPAKGQSADAVDCLLEPKEVTRVGSAIPGILQVVTVDRGDTVKRGTVIARLDSRAEKAALDVARARAEFGKRTDERNNELFRDELISVYDRDASATESLLAQLEYEQAAVALSMREIKSPIDGVVTERYKTGGEYVQGDEILRIARLNPLNVEVVAPLGALKTITRGGKAVVKPRAPVGGEYTATVIAVDPVVDAASSTFRVRLSLPNPGNRIPAGVRCDIEFASSAREN